jgi:hypothetical protein
MSTGDSIIGQSAKPIDGEQLTFRDVMSDRSNFQLSAQPVFDGAAVLNGGSGIAPAAPPANSFDGRAVLFPQQRTPNAYDGRTPLSSAPYNGNHQFFQARPDWRGPQSQVPARPTDQIQPPGYIPAQPGAITGQPGSTRPIDATLTPTGPTYQGGPPRYPIPSATAPLTPEAQFGGVPTTGEQLVQLAAGAGFYSIRNRIWPLPEVHDAVQTRESEQALTKPATEYGEAGVKYQEALEDHFKPVSKLMEKVTPANAEAIRGHALMTSTHPDLAMRREVLASAHDEATRDGWKKVFDKFAAKRPGFADQARDFFTETERVQSWLDKGVESARRLKDTPPVADQRIVDAMTGDNRIAAAEYKVKTQALSDTMLERLKVQGEEFTREHRFANGLGWFAAAGAFDMWYDKNYYTDVKPSWCTYGGDIAQMAVAAYPAMGRIKVAVKLALMAGTHFFGRSLDAKDQHKV